MTLNFTVGPVQSEKYICNIAGEQVPYFRTKDFSEIVLESEEIMCRFTDAPKGSRALFITGSGTASMEASVMNIFDSTDKLLVINGGSFGNRFCEICNIHKIPFTEVKLPFGHNITEQILKQYDGCGYTGLLVNVDETSSGVLYDMGLISRFCKRNELILVADAISSFLADDISMRKLGIDVLLTGSQKALACQPGVSIIVLSPKAVGLVETHDVPSLYLDLKIALKNGERGQTPFTPAVGTIRQIHARLKSIDKNGGVSVEIDRVGRLADYFRSEVSSLPLEFITDSKSNAVTALYTNDSAVELFIKMKEKHDIWICPNGGQYAEHVFRVGHIGNLKQSDFDVLLTALAEELR